MPAKLITASAISLIYHRQHMWLTKNQWVDNTWKEHQELNRHRHPHRHKCSLHRCIHTHEKRVSMVTLFATELWFLELATGHTKWTKTYILAVSWFVPKCANDSRFYTKVWCELKLLGHTTTLCEGGSSTSNLKNLLLTQMFLFHFSQNIIPMRRCVDNGNFNIQSSMLNAQHRWMHISVLGHSHNAKSVTSTGTKDLLYIRL